MKLLRKSLQTDILRLLAEPEQEYTQKQIAKLLKKHASHTCRAISKLKKKNLITEINQGSYKNYRLTNKGKNTSYHLDPPYTPPSPPKVVTHQPKKGKKSIENWRVHALHFVIRPYYFHRKTYDRIRTEHGNHSIRFKGWTFKLHPDMVEMQLESGRDFVSPDKWEALRMASDDFNTVLNKACGHWGFDVWKEGKCNIRLVNQHLAVNPSEFADDVGDERIRIRGSDNKIWLLIDKSKGLEHEYTHPDRSLGDSEIFEPYLNDMRNNLPPTNSELLRLSWSLANNQQIYNANIEKHLGVMDKIEESLTSIVKLAKKNQKT